MAYDEGTRTKAVILYRLLGSLAMVSAQMGLAYDTLKLWKRSEWWTDKEEEIRRASRSELSGNLRKIVDKAILAVEDRLEHGDYFYDQKTGEIKRKPVGAHVANAILGGSFDRAMALEKLMNSEAKTVDTEAIQDRLLKLAEDFERFARSKTIQGEYSALHDKREEGLQERGGLGPESQDPGTGSGGAPQGSSDAGEGGSGEEGGRQAGGPQATPVEGGSGDREVESASSAGQPEHVLRPEQGRINGEKGAETLNASHS